MARKPMFGKSRPKLSTINEALENMEPVVQEEIKDDLPVRKEQYEDNKKKDNEFGNMKVNPSDNEDIAKGEKYVIKGVLLSDPIFMEKRTLDEAYNRKKTGLARMTINVGTPARSRKKEVTGFLPIEKDDNGKCSFKFKRGDSVKAICEREIYRGKAQNKISNNDIETYHEDNERGFRGRLKEIRGVGDVMINRYIENYGTDKSHLTNVEDLEKIGFKKEVAERIVIEWSAASSYKENMELLRHTYSLNKDIAESLISSYGDSIKDILKTDPWSLNVRNVNFDTWDKIAAHNKIPMNAKSRIRAGVAYYIRKAIEENGSTCWSSENSILGSTVREAVKEPEKKTNNNAPVASSFGGGRRRRMVVSSSSVAPKTSNNTASNQKTPQRIGELLKNLNGGNSSSSSSSVMVQDIRDAIDYLTSKECYEENPQIALIKDKGENGEELIFPIENYMIERELANKIVCISKLPPMRSREEAKRGVDAVCKTKGIVLNEQQYNAAIDACTYRFTVITGGAGTGKSTIQDVIASTLVYFKDKVSLSSPTGKAAKRLSQTTKRPADTIHRQLEIFVSEDGELEFKRNYDNPIEGNTALIGDEMGMGDTYITNSLLDAFPVNGSVVFVGDFNQLASVGKGQVFRDIIESNNPDIHVNKLTISMRTNDNSDVTWAGREILKGNNPWRQKNSIRGVTHYEATGDGIFEKVNEIANNILPSHGYETTKDVIILSPLRGKISSRSAKLPEGTVSDINMSFKSVYNPAKNKEEQKIGMYGMTEGDPIIGNRNNYVVDIRNGEDGIVKEINTNGAEVSIKADIDGVDKTLTEKDGLKDVELAYANTVHKFQGSERPAVIIAIPSGFAAKKLLSRNLLYTALTRAENEVHIVGPMEMIDWAVNHEEKRLTGLPTFINRRSRELQSLPVKEQLKENKFLNRLIERRCDVFPKEKVKEIEAFMEANGIEESSNVNENKGDEVVRHIDDFNYGM